MTHSNSSSAFLGDLCTSAVQNSFTATRRIPNGSWCLLREPSDGSRDGKIVIVQSRDIQDPETIVQYSVLKGSEQLFASKYRTVLPTEEELIAELERERRVIEQKQNGGETCSHL